ncbi:MAG: hypothetical protein GY754_37830 [bacterium]|nr:hypothetical protein [bacterium]
MKKISLSTLSKTALTLLVVSSLVFISLSAFSKTRALKISGLQVYEEEDLEKKLGLKKDMRRRGSTRRVIKKIRRFYKRRGFTLVKIYILKNKRKELSIFVDEGRLGKIIFHDQNAVKVLMLKRDFELDEKVYNVKTIKKSIKQIKKYHQFKKVYYRLQRIENYKKSEFQLDRKVDLPVLGETQLPFFDEIGKRYNLIIYIDELPPDMKKRQRKNNKKQRRKEGFGYGFKVSFNGFAPQLKYYQYDLFQRDDFIEAGTTLGINYRIINTNKEDPQFGFFQFDSKYHFRPIPLLKQQFTPEIRGLIYYSSASRADLGLTSFNYLLTQFTFLPGFELFKHVKVYAGLGIEDIYYGDSENDPESDYQVNIANRNDIYVFFTSEIKLEAIPIRIGNIMDRNISLTYNHYFHHANSFNELILKGKLDTQFKNKSIYSFEIGYNFKWSVPPYHHEESSGFSTYYTKHKLFQGNEYRISLYKDFIYTGLFFNMTLFKGSGYDISGTHFGFVGGPTVRFLLLDHFELLIKYGQSYLVTTKETAGNLAFSLFKKW